MSRSTDADGLLEQTLARQREMVRFLKRAAKDTDDGACKRLFKHLGGVVDDQMTDVAAELARHRKERRLGNDPDDRAEDDRHPSRRPTDSGGRRVTDSG